jgi:hypothetical protein
MTSASKGFKYQTFNEKKKPFSNHLFQGGHNDVLKSTLATQEGLQRTRSHFTFHRHFAIFFAGP